jgi:hypothetical protein
MINSFSFISQPISASSFAYATGGEVVSTGSYRIHTFTASADLTVINDGLYNVFLVGGGGGGGNSGQRGGGGGGGGGIVNVPRVVLSSSICPVIVGAGGGPGNPASPGGTSSLANLVALGGGGGGGNQTFATNGGSGGGGVRLASTPGIGSQSLSPNNSGVFGYGQNGNTDANNNTGGGGGGAGVTGSSGPNGNDGLAFDISGTSSYYAGGGGGGFSTAGGFSYPGGLGGGGAGNSGNGVANTGGGGGGANPDNRSGGTGGSGIAIIKYQYLSDDPDTLDFINATGITGTNATAIDSLVYNLKSYGLWNKLYTFYPFIGGTSATCKYNLVDPADTDAAYRITYRNEGNLTFNSNGVQNTSGSSNVGMITNFNLISASVGFNWSAGVYGAVANPGGIDVAVYSGAGSNSSFYLGGNIVSANIALTDCFSEGDGRIVVGNTSAVGFYSVSSTSASSLKLYKNGAVIGTNTSTRTNTPPSWPISIGGNHYQSTGIIQDVSTQQFRSVYFSQGLTDTEMQNMSLCVTTFNAALGRNV